MGVRHIPVALGTIIAALSADTAVAKAPRPRNFYSELHKLAPKVGVIPTPAEMNFGNNVKIINNHSDSSVRILAPLLPDVHGKTISLLWYKKDIESVRVLSVNNPELTRIVKLLDLHVKLFGGGTSR